MRYDRVINLDQKSYLFRQRIIKKLLKEIAERADNVTISIKDGTLRLSIFIGYFDEVY